MGYRIGLCLLLLLCGCGKKVSVLERANKEKCLIVGTGIEPETLDPHTFTSVNSLQVIRSLFEGLTKPNPKTLKPEPAVAESWTVSKNGKTYTFFLKDTQWSNGDPVTAKDFEVAFRRALSADLASPSSSLLFVLKNAKNFFEGKIPFGEVGVEVLDDKTLRLTLEQPTPYFLSLLYSPAWAPVNEKNILEHGKLDERNTPWSQLENMVVNGPFLPGERQFGEFIEVKKNPNYWNADNIFLEKIRFTFIPDANTEERAFRDNRLHITEQTLESTLHHYKDRNCVTITPSLFSFYYICNTTKPPLDNPLFRKALSLAIDREKLEKINRSPSQTIVPKHFGLETQTDLNFNPKRAKALLQESGYLPESLPKLTLTVNGGINQKRTAEMIQEMWRKNLGLNVEIETFSWKAYLAKRRQGDFLVARGGWFADYNDPQAFLELWKSDNINNFAQWNNPQFDSLIEKAISETNEVERLQLLADAEALIIENAPALPLFITNEIRLVHESVQNWQPNALGWHVFENVNLE